MASDGYELAAFWAFLVFCYFVLRDGVVEALDEHFVAFWAVGVFVFVALNVSDVGVVDALFFGCVVGIFQGFDWGGWVCEFVGWVVACEV